MKSERSPGVRIVKRQDYAPGREKRITKERRQGDCLVNVKKTVLAWIHEFETKRILDSRREFSNLFGAKVVAVSSTLSLKTSRQSVVRKKCRHKVQGTQVREKGSNSSQIPGQSHLAFEDIL